MSLIVLLPKDELRFDKISFFLNCSSWAQAGDFACTIKVPCLTSCTAVLSAIFLPTAVGQRVRACCCLTPFSSPVLNKYVFNTVLMGLILNMWR